jgi:hypothetical protein
VIDFVDRADVRVIQHGGVAGLAKQATPGRFCVGRVSDDFQGDGSMERRVVGKKDRAHSAFAQLAGGVRTDDLAIFHQIECGLRPRRRAGAPSGRFRVWCRTPHASAQSTTIEARREQGIDAGTTDGVRGNHSY